ncbi:MAG TPA: hypothetical protein VMY59_09920, partial [Candidatus Thermoplasmatota archaeon]|nr:hypothetical protein [Candidatus Thermoplasmatota archaeon]
MDKKPISIIKHPTLGTLKETYWANYAQKTFTVKKHVLKNGKWETLQMTNPNTGLPIYEPNGNFMFVEEEHRFEPYRASAGIINGKDVESACFFRVFEKTPPYIIDALEKDRQEGAVYNNEEFEKRSNPEKWQEYTEKVAVIAERDSLSKDNEILKKRLAELEKKNSSEIVKKT